MSTAKSVKKPDEGRLAQVLVAPIISERPRALPRSRTGAVQGAAQRHQPEIKAAVELLFKVEVASVQTVNQLGKTKRFGRSIGRRDHVKKAYVCLKPGQELNYSGEAA